MRFNPLLKDLAFLLIIVVMSALYYDGVLNKGSLGVPIWRQADCLSLTKNYAEGASFLEPEMPILLADDYTTGKSAGEFPIIYSSVGKMWSAFCQSYFSYSLFYSLITRFR